MPHIRNCLGEDMTRMTSQLSHWVAVLLLTASSASLAQSPASAPAFSAAQLLAPPTTAWITNGGTLYNQRYSPLSTLNRDNVAGLRALWRTSMNSGTTPGHAGQAQILSYEGVLYVSNGANDVFALQVETGNILWTYHGNPDLHAGSPIGRANRGVALGDGKVFVTQADAKLTALDQRSGAVVWTSQVERWEDGYAITAAPLYFDGLVITGVNGGEMGTRGKLRAFDAKTGKLTWTFYTVPGPGEKGHETWPADSDAWQRGGASIWQTPAIDPELGLIYFSTANPGPDLNGSVRKGDNLFANSIVALDVRTGSYRWHFQEVHHDIWDYDAPNPVVLFDAKIAGKQRKGLAQVGKTGWAYILDRVTGKPLVGIDERAVPQDPRQLTAATQPYPRGDAIVPQHIDIAPEGYDLVNGGRIFTPFFGNKGLVASPSLYGGANWPPSSLDPVRKRLFVCASDVPGLFVGGSETHGQPPVLGENYVGGVVGFAQLPRSGVFAAVDVTTNKLVWRQRWMDQCYSGSVATAGGLVFVGRNDGRLTALDSDTGHTLWQFQTGAGLNAPASVFEYAGKQYVVALSAGNALAGTAHGDSVWLFGLDGKLPPAQARDSELAAAPAAMANVASAAAASKVSGAEIFQQACVPCHGPDGKGGHGGGAPLDKATDLAAVVRTITEGRKTMPPFGGALTAEQIQAVSSYIVKDLFK